MRRAIPVSAVAAALALATTGAAPAGSAGGGILERFAPLTPKVGLLGPDSRGTPLRWTRDDGATWKPVTVTAGPVTVGG